jgi:hypothetical protein
MPCQFGGRPVCSECGCIASAGLASIGKYKVAGLIPVSKIFDLSKKVGERCSLLRPPRFQDLLRRLHFPP